MYLRRTPVRVIGVVAVVVVGTYSGEIYTSQIDPCQLRMTFIPPEYGTGGLENINLHPGRPIVASEPPGARNPS